ncbi:nuclear pore complex protein Nup133 isoform X2 [Harpegnathos saltator]|uniref:Nuclear pore complex protein Nup133 n=1 Tax=Harpegnathos saltator TaxID=610380 RepID=E2BNB0_HARSA|nr:nuclear pore complex protein Nup133 isoform X2 [Harpegnathos saltator]EFN82872.1 Nuclear pore complex protein Nup133 [Harpegnathos saltator]
MDRTSLGGSLGRSIASPRKRISIVQSLKKSSSAASVSGRTNQSVQTICRTPSHTVESFGSSLPVLVTEALTFVDRNTAVSVNVSTDGWAWLVYGRKLLVWQCKTTIHDPKQRRTFKTQCRELLLPQSDLAHKADCIAVWIPPGHQVPSCMAVSPEGIVRFWASVAHEGSSVETSAELAGQEVDCLMYVSGHGCILATTTCTVALLQPQFNNGKNTVTCQVLRTSQGWLGGIGRRMTSLIFGAIPQSPVAETKLVKVTCTPLSERGSRVLILAGSSLQYWLFSHNEQEKMEFDEDITHIVSQAFQRKLWESSPCNPQRINTWFIDMQTCDEGIVLLMAAYYAEISLQIHFALGLIPLTGTSLSNTFKWFVKVQIDPLFYDDDMEMIESTLSSYRFILSGWEAIIYNQYNVLVVNTASEIDQDKIDLVRGGEDSILGGALCSGTPVLFTKSVGLVSITPVDFATQDFNTGYAEANMSMDYSYKTNQTAQNFSTLISNEELQDMYYSSDGATQLRTAFLLSLRQNKAQCDDILSQLFPLQEDPVMDIDATLDTLILKVAKDLIDDYPANDPRWANHRDLSITVNAVTSMQIPHQLEGKQKALDLFVQFLKEHNLWSKFCAVTYRGTIMSTSHVLGEYAEKIVAAMTIYNLQTRYSEIIDAVIDETLQPEAYISDELTARDIFFREVSTVHLFLPTLINKASEVTQSERPLQQVGQYIMQVNGILLAVLHEVVKYRQYNAERFVPAKCSNVITEYLPWTASPGKHGLRNCLNTMQSITTKHGVTGTSDSTVRNELYAQLVILIDLILDGRKCHLESIRGTEKFEILLKQYETDRANLIQPLIKEEQYDNAAMLAEKYCDFPSLVQICELTNNKNRLDGYIVKFAAQDFVGFLFSWYVKDGRQGQLVERCRRGGTVELTEKLLEHPTLSWVQAALTDELRLAANTLHTLAAQEAELVTRKKSMLSLAKLALLASDESEDKIVDNTKMIDNELALIAYQEDLPTQVLTTYGYDIEKLRVLTPRELIMLYTSNENVIANEYDFKKALDLLDYVEQEEDKLSLKLQIWARAARRNQWNTVDKNPEQQVQETLFFKLMDLVYFMGGKVEEFLPSVDVLLKESELEELATSSNFQFLIKLIYEYAYRNY